MLLFIEKLNNNLNQNQMMVLVFFYKNMGGIILSKKVIRNRMKDQLSILGKEHISIVFNRN